MQAGASAWFAGGLGVFYGIWKFAELYDKPSEQPYVRFLSNSLTLKIDALASKRLQLDRQGRDA